MKTVCTSLIRYLIKKKLILVDIDKVCSPTLNKLYTRLESPPICLFVCYWIKYDKMHLILLYCENSYEARWKPLVQVKLDII